MLVVDKTEEMNLFVQNSYKSKVENHNFLSISREKLFGNIGLGDKPC